MNTVKDFRIPLPDDNNCIILICILKNEYIMLEYFLKYYSALGITHFICIDNDSSDGSLEYLRDAHDNILLLHTNELFKDNKMKWTTHVLDTYCKNRWCAILDADELIYVENLRYLIQQLNEEQANMCVFYLLDMYPKDTDQVYRKGEPFLQHSNYYDKESSINNWWGSGLRKRVMDINVCLRKHAFFKYIFSGCYSLTTGCHQIQTLVETPCIKKSKKTRILLHFKFIRPNLKELFEIRAREEQYWNNSIEYKTYCKRNDYAFYDPAYSACIDDIKPTFSFI